MNRVDYHTTRLDLERSLVLHRAELDRSLQNLGRTARERIDPGAIVARHPYAGMLTLAALGFWLGSR